MSDPGQTTETHPSSPLFDDRYRILAQIGEGGFGRVFAVADTHHGDSKLALKCIRPAKLVTSEAEERFRKEIEILRTLRHESIPQIYNDGWSADGGFYFTMQLVEGPTLARELEQSGPWSARRAVTLLLDLVATLEYAHSRGVIHRDLKPSNVVCERGARGRERFVILDFGIAKLLAGAGESSLGLVTAAGVGTPSYMSPEQRLGLTIDERTDVFGLGALLYRVLSGRPPDFPRSSTGSAGIEAWRPAPLDSARVPPELEHLILRMLAVDRVARPSLREVRTCAERLQRSSASRRSRRIAVTLSAVALFVTAARVLRRAPVKADFPPYQPPGEVVPGPAPTPPGSPGDPSGFVSASGTSTGGAAAAEVVCFSPDPATPLRLAGSQPGPAREARAVLLPSGFSSAIDTITLQDGSPTRVVHERTGIVLVRLPEGQARVGAGAADADARPDERPARTVSLDVPVFLAECEVTQAQYDLFCAESGWPAAQRPAWPHTPEHPVVYVSWEDAHAFARWASMELPSEALLQYASAHVSPRRYPWGDAIPATRPAALENFADQDSRTRLSANTIGRFPWSDGFEATAPVGSFPPNELGFHDLLGNVAEWCADAYALPPTYPLLVPQTDAELVEPHERVIRGGSWASTKRDCRTSSRATLPQTSRQGYIGFRVALVIRP